MHGMLSAAILICLFAAIAAASGYAAVRVYAAGRRPRGGKPDDWAPAGRDAP
jgi:hypothetical protein